jgi:8-oxo-dGTP diphosphatase
MKEIRVSAAVIIHNKKILCVQRGENKLKYISNKFEFPGGKIEPGESPSKTVIREIKEELNMVISAQKELIVVEHTYPDFHITMHTYLCSCCDDKVFLNEHISYKWLNKEELNTLDWAEADIPIVNFLNK